MTDKQFMKTVPLAKGLEHRFDEKYIMIDIPKNCRECTHGKEILKGHKYCREKERMNHNLDILPEWCPFKSSNKI